MATDMPIRIELPPVSSNDMSFHRSLEDMQDAILSSFALPARLLQAPRQHMITLESPVPAAMIVDRAWGPLIDYLLDEGFDDLGAMAILFAGRPPRHEDGLPQDMLAHWLEATGRGKAASQVRGVTLNDYEERAPGWPYGTKVRGVTLIAERAWRDRRLTGVIDKYGPLRAGTVHLIANAMVDGRTPDVDSLVRAEVALVVADELARARRAISKAVLSLPFFSHLAFTRRCEISALERETYERPDRRSWLSSKGIDPGLYYFVSEDIYTRRIVITQNITAPNLIWVGAIEEKR